MFNIHKAKILKIDSISFLDYPDDESIAIVIYFMGCAHNCSGCHNLKFQDSDYINGDVEEFTLHKFKIYIEKLVEKHRTSKIVLSGGDPLHSNNIDFVKEFVESTPYDICIYTGYSINHVRAFNLSNFKFLKCGKYLFNMTQVSEKTDRYLQFSSKNQKLYNSNYKLISKNGRYYFKKGGDV